MKLAKWEDRGHYAQKQEAEKSQRQLHKMVRDSQEVLKRPAAGVIGSVSAAMGFADVAKQQQEADKEADPAERPNKRARITETQPWSWKDKVGAVDMFSISKYEFPCPVSIGVLQLASEESIELRRR